MADPLSTAAGIIGVIQLTSTIVSYCYEYLKGARETAQDIAMVISQVGSVESTLRALDHLNTAANEDEDSRLAIFGQLMGKDGPMETCRSVLRELEAKLRPVTSRGKLSRALIWPLKAKETRKMLEVIEGYKSTFILALAGDHTRLITRVRDHLSEIRQTVQRIERLQIDEYSDRILGWLAATDYASSHRSARGKHEPTTGEWLLRSDKFLHWEWKKRRFIWSHGIPGCGKTVLSSTVIEHIISLCNTTDDHRCVYFYFEYNDPQKQTVMGLLRAIVAQLLLQEGFIPETIKELYTQHGNGRQQPDTPTLISTILSLLQGCERLYLILDALDECSERETLLSLLSRLWNQDDGRINLLVTSRRERDLEMGLRDLVTDIICVQDEVVGEDIKVHICSRLAADPKLNRWPDDIRKEIEDALVEGAEGM